MLDSIVRCAAIVSIALSLTACTGGGGSRTLIQNKGSDTLVNVAQAWAETYRTVNPAVAVAVSGGGSGTGIASLINGTVDLANASRGIKALEQEEIEKANGVEAIEHTVAADAVVFFIHKDNPIEGLNIEQLACMYGEGGKCSKWTDLDVEVPGCANQEIILVSRQSNSGTYVFVRDMVLGEKRDFRLGTRDMQGSKDVVDLVGHTPCAIGYSGLGYANAEVRASCVAKDASSKCIEPTTETAKSGTYPLSRPLFMYTLGQPTGPVLAYLDWIKSDAGQTIVANNGFVPVN